MRPTAGRILPKTRASGIFRTKRSSAVRGSEAAFQYRGTVQFCRHGGTGGQIFRKNQLVELDGFHHLPGGFDTLGFAHPHVEENDLRPGNADNFNRLAAVFSKHHFTANHRQHGGKHVAVFRDVIHHKGPDVLSRAEAEDIAGWQRGSGW